MTPLDWLPDQADPQSNTDPDDDSSPPKPKLEPKPKPKPKTRPGEISITQPGTRRIGDIEPEEESRWGPARFNSQTVLELKESDTGETFRFNQDAITQLIIGRIDPSTGERPDVDLNDLNALEKGVSRRHAIISLRDGALHLIDQGSPNGTFLNGQRLVAYQSRILRDGDDIRLGHLVLRVTYFDVDENTQRPRVY